MPDYNYKEDYGPLIIDSVVQTPIISAPIPQTNTGYSYRLLTAISQMRAYSILDFTSLCVNVNEFSAHSSSDKKEERSKNGDSGTKSKFGFGLRKSVFSRKKDEKTPDKNLPENSGTLTKKKKDEETDSSTPKRGFGRLSFSRRKPKTESRQPTAEGRQTNAKSRKPKAEIRKAAESRSGSRPGSGAEPRG